MGFGWGRCVLGPNNISFRQLGDGAVCTVKIHLADCMSRWMKDRGAGDEQVFWCRCGVSLPCWVKANDISTIFLHLTCLADGEVDDTSVFKDAGKHDLNHSIWEWIWISRLREY